MILHWLKLVRNCVSCIKIVIRIVLYIGVVKMRRNYRIRRILWFLNWHLLVITRLYCMLVVDLRRVRLAVKYTDLNRCALFNYFNLIINKELKLLFKIIITKNYEIYDYYQVITRLI